MIGQKQPFKRGLYNMSDRVFRRVPVNIEAEIISCRSSYPAFIRNVSEYGILVKVANIEPAKISNCEIELDLKFQLPSGETVNLFGRKKWAYKNTSNSFIENIGVEIIDPPDKYKDFYKVLSHL
ncbi:MAG: PilZ domain-containing protein [Nitrospiraceae bacterium]|nr:MAG: PilZ domain-containing protein [Nitrospiraceae bacterium]